MAEWSKAKQDKVAEKISAGLVKVAIENANRNPGDQAAQKLAGDMSDMLTAYRRGDVPE